MSHVIYDGSKKIQCNQQNYLASGGEAEVYVEGDVAYKVYFDPKKMLPIGKIQELGQLTSPNFIKPEGPIFDAKKRPVGYKMRYIKGGIALCQYFPVSYRKREGITPDMTFNLVQIGQEVVHSAHKDADIFIVDLNEMNLLFTETHDNLWFIDCDSYNTPSYLATAIIVF